MSRLRRGAIILAGGNSVRMGWTDKALVNLGSKPLLAHIVQRVADIVDAVTVVISKEGEIDRYKTVLPGEVEVVKDTISECGPVAGILTGAEASEADYTVVLPCDAPFVEPRVIGYLFESALGADAAVPRWPSGYIEPLHSVYRVKALRRAGKVAFKGSNPPVRILIEGIGKVIYVPTRELRRFDSELLTFFNINTITDLEAARKMYMMLKSHR
ncbi:MAG: molybdenum cofactor guanylyltransferase [Candidatus Bathyarchaeia archaeon]